MALEASKSRFESDPVGVPPAVVNAMGNTTSGRSSLAFSRSSAAQNASWATPGSKGAISPERLLVAPSGATTSG